MTMLERYRLDRQAPCLIIADHAGKEVPADIPLGVSEAELARHIGWDIGAATVTRRMADLLGVPALLCHVSRLVIDPNRRPNVASAMPPFSDGTQIPGNQQLDRAQIDDRIRRFFLPYHRAIARWIAEKRRAGTHPVIIAMHSFTPRMLGIDRPWHIGILWRGDRRLSDPLLRALEADPLLTVGDNQPYSGQEDFGYTVTFHAQRTNLPHVMLELRQDQIDTDPKALGWADRLAALFAPLLADPGLYRLQEPDNFATLPPGTSWREACGWSAIPR